MAKTKWLIDTTIGSDTDPSVLIPGYEVLTDDEYHAYKHRIFSRAHKKFTQRLPIRDYAVDKYDIREMLENASMITARQEKTLNFVNQCENRVVRNYFAAYDAKYPKPIPQPKSQPKPQAKKRFLNGFNGEPVEMAVWNTPMLSRNEPVKYIRTVVAYEPDSVEGKGGRPWKAYNVVNGVKEYGYWENAQKVR